MSKEQGVKEATGRGIDPRPKYMTKRTQNDILRNLFDYTLYYDPILSPDGEFNGMIGNVMPYSDFTTFMADFKTAGGNIPTLKPFEDKEYSLPAASARYGISNRDLTKPQEFHYELIRECANAIRLGVVVDLDERTREILSNSTQKHLNSQGMRALTGERSFSHHWDPVVPYARMLDLDFKIPFDWKEQARSYLIRHQDWEIEEPIQGGRAEDSLYYAMRFGDLAANIAEARILGIDVPIREELLPRVHKTVALAKKDSKFRFPAALTHLTVLTASEVTVGLPRGLDVRF